ncbi:MAG: VWA domain-containing protein [Chitinispirillaceae bacterium]|jgi:Ca-activated chloride channel family protein|nr:VWA domain-containing protein [Chitinispirillaceae bacterium]
MHFGNPELFLLLLLVPLFIGFFLWAWQRKRLALARFAELRLLEKLMPAALFSRQAAKGTLLIFFFVFLVCALVRPRFGVKMEMFERRGIDLMVALDISESMLAQDIAPNRLDRAKHEIAKLMDLLRGDRVGLIVFAGESFVQCPLTLDYGAAKMFLDAVSTGWVQIQGTALAEAIDQAREAFNSKAHKHKVLVLISDGEDHEGSAVDAAKKAAGEGVIIYTVGVGSESGVPIPISKSGSVVYKKDKSGNLVMTRLDPVTLEKIAIESNGKYFHAGTDLDLSRIMAEIERMEKKALGSSHLNIHEERYQFFLLIALLLLITEFFIPDRGRRTQEWKGRFE